MQMKAGADASISSWGPVNLDVFCIGTDNQLKHRPFRSGSGWHAWENQGGILTAGVDSVSWGNNRIDVVSRNSNSRMVHKAWDGSQFTAWTERGGSLAGTPTISSGALGHLDVLATAVDGNIWKRSYDLSWELDFGRVGVAGSEPDAVSWGPGRIDMAVRDPASGNIQHLLVDNNR